MKSQFEVSFVAGRFIESVTVEAIDREEAQEAAIDFWEQQGVAHGDLRVVRKAQSLPLIPFRGLWK